MSVHRRSRCRYLGRYFVFRAGIRINIRLFLLASGRFMHITNSCTFITASILPPF